MLRSRTRTVALLVALAACASGREQARFAGTERCASCHAPEFRGWQASQHARAMQLAASTTVLARFDSTRANAGDATATFVRRDGRYVVITQGSDGRLHDFEVRYTFGVAPLQQYLVSFPGGRLQALSLAWDTRPASLGGQRWFSLRPEDLADHSAESHWTGRHSTWNYMCADCHSTGVRKNYEAASDSYRSTFAEINVACEACHGPGSAHVKWASYPTVLRRLWRDDGLPARLTERRGVRWTLASGARTASRSEPRQEDREIETCAQCHARRVHIADGYVAGRRFMDHYIPALITSDVYYPDGQQKEEVYTYGSFRQSRMYHAGVTCSDCHDPHTQHLRRPGNQTCTQCHRAEAFDSPAHHFHQEESPGARCVSCHMPDTTYMRIDPRHDHSFRIPRPDLSLSLGVPNACTRCHTDRDDRWAADALRRHYPRPNPGFQRFAEVFAADDRGADATQALAAIAADSAQPAIVRASALARLGAHRTDLALAASESVARHPDPLVRLAALQNMEIAQGDRRVALAAPLLNDSMRAVRQGAAWVLAPVTGLLSPPQRDAFATAAAEFVASQRYNADQPEDLLTLGAFYAQRERFDSAVAAYREALRRAPTYVTASIYLAGALRAQGRVDDALRALEDARRRSPDDPRIAAMLRTFQPAR